MDLDLRLVRYFVVVAEQQHFGRAAALLHLAQPSLSRQIRRLEQQLGARLLDRTPQGSRLTEAGQVFLPLAQSLLRSAGQAAARTRAAADPSRITIGFTSNILITQAVRELRHRNPDADVQTVHLEWDEARSALLEHRVDVALARLPFLTDQLHVTILYDEPRAVLLPRDHRLAGKESVTLDDIADEPMPQVRDPMFNAFWRVDPRPDGSRAPDGPLVQDLEEKLELVASGQAVSIVAASREVAHFRPDLTTVPLAGVEPSHVVLASRAGEKTRLITAFRMCAEAHITGPRPVSQGTSPGNAIPGNE
jgi:DNA-binding transcriptional LysR family regulator